MKAHTVLDKNHRILTRIPAFTPELVEDIKEYLEANEFPLVSGLAIHIGVSRNTIRQWAMTIPEFTPYYDYLVTKQDSYLINGMLNQTVNPIAAIFLSKAILGYKDQPDRDDATHITVNTTNYVNKDTAKKAEKELKEIGLLGKAIKDKKRNKDVTPNASDVDNKENEDS